MRSFLNDFSEYMRSLASEHNDILNSDNDRHYFRGEVEEFFQNLRSEVNFPCLVQEACEIEYRHNGAGFMKVRKTAFIIADDYDQRNDYGDIEQCLSLCERIGEDVMGRIIYDGVYMVDTENISASYLQNQQHKYVGCRFAFEIVEPACMYNPKKWQR